MRPDRPLCDKDGCCHLASFEYFVQWTEQHASFDVWRACTHHRMLVRDALKSGLWTGGVQPRKMLETRDPEWAG